MKKSEDGRFILEGQNDRNELTPPSRRKLCNLVCDFLLEKYDDPPTTEVKSLCVELVGIFPLLKHEPSNMGGIVNSILFVSIIFSLICTSVLIILQDMVYNPTNGTGFLLNTLRYRKNKRSRATGGSFERNERPLNK